MKYLFISFWLSLFCCGCTTENCPSNTPIDANVTFSRKESSILVELTNTSHVPLFVEVRPYGGFDWTAFDVDGRVVEMANGGTPGPSMAVRAQYIIIQPSQRERSGGNSFDPLNCFKVSIPVQANTMHPEKVVGELSGFLVGKAMVLRTNSLESMDFTVYFRASCTNGVWKPFQVRTESVTSGNGVGQIKRVTTGSTEVDHTPVRQK